jgi:hypothetical protein
MSAIGARCVLAFSVLATLAACAESADPGDRSCEPGTPGCATVGAPTAGVGGTSVSPPAAGNAGSTGTAGQPSALQGVPCNVAQIVSDNCTLCHGTQRLAGATMSLMTFADFHAPAPSNPQRKVYEVVGDRINAQAIAMRMPPASSDALAAPDLAAMNAWLNAGATAALGAAACAISAEPGTTGMAGAGAGGNVAPPPPGPGASGGLQEEPIDYEDPEMQCYELRAHAPSDKSQPYSVPTTPDYYVNFDFMAPWDGMAYTRSYRTLIDNGEVVHHWLFYKNAGPKTDGAVSQSSGVHPDGQLSHGWAPGGTDMYFHKDVGAEMPSTTSYTLELHYNNTTGSAQPDASGIEVCVTPTQPSFVASISWLGTDNISGTSAQGTCDPSSSERIHLIGATPHMHTKGTHMKVVLNRAAGGMESLHDLPFDFNYQRGYTFDTWIEPGDTISTTCSYSAPASFGEGTNDEMCYWFAMHYPSNGLTNGNPIAGLIHGPNTCLQ